MAAAMTGTVRPLPSVVGSWLTVEMAMSNAERQRNIRARRALAAERAVGQPGRPVTQPHGTVAGFRRHERAGEPACDACAEANRQQQAAYYQARRARVAT